MEILKFVVSIAIALMSATLQGCGGGGGDPSPTPAPPPSPTPSPTPETPKPTSSPTAPPCEYDAVVFCSDGTRCEGNECCVDTTTCPSAHPDYKGCPLPKKTDCTAGGTPAPTMPTPPTPTPGNGTCKVGDHVKCPGTNEPCSGNQCCQDTTTCPSADPSFDKCPMPKTVDCVGGQAPGYCTTADCCSKNADAADQQLCQDFFSTEHGIAFTMLSTATWQGQDSKYDKAVFNKEPPATSDKDAQQAMSLTHYEKSARPYPGYSNSYGLAFPMGPSSTFWKYFQKLSTGDGHLCAQCTDGQACCPTCGVPVGGSYDDFQKEKNAIMEETGTPECKKNPLKTQYNEFDTNGLSSNDLAGIFFNTMYHGGPTFTDQQLCAILAKTKQNREKWPVYNYAFNEQKGSSSLLFDRYITCASALTVAV